MGDVCSRIRAPNNLCPLRPAYPFAHSDEQKADTEKQTPTGSGRDRQGLRMDGLRLGGRMEEDLGVTPRTRAVIQARDLGSGKLK
jgi:hypothetical protein